MINELKYSIVIPVYRSQKTLGKLYECLCDIFERIEGEFEIILVEDAGGDGSWQVMKRLRAQDKRVRIIKLARNFGQHNALLCGFSYVRGQYVFTIDDDLQNPPEQLLKLLNVMEQDPSDVIYGIYEQKKHSMTRRVGSFLFNFLMKKCGACSDIQLSNVRMIRRSVIDEILRIPTVNPIIDMMLAGVTDSFSSVRIEHHERLSGKTGYSMKKLVKLFLQGILYYTTLPLKALFVIGTASMGISLILGTVYFAMYMAGVIDVSGWTTIILLILFFSGILTLSMGIISQYLLRIVQEVQKRPCYTIRDEDT